MDPPGPSPSTSCKGPTVPGPLDTQILTRDSGPVCNAVNDWASCPSLSEVPVRLELSTSRKASVAIFATPGMESALSANSAKALCGQPVTGWRGDSEGPFPV